MAMIISDSLHTTNGFSLPDNQVTLKVLPRC